MAQLWFAADKFHMAYCPWAAADTLGLPIAATLLAQLSVKFNIDKFGSAA
jgi:hypothetical protein